VAVNGVITATFDEAMDPATITAATFAVSGPGGTPVAGSVSLDADGTVATFTPASALAGESVYTAVISTEARDVAGNPLASAFGWSFATADVGAPIVSSTVPDSGAAVVAINVNITATFSEAMNSATITGTTFTLTGPGVTPVAGAVSYAGVVATFNPTANLANFTVYTATITTGAKDTHGNALASNKVWTFTTGDFIAPTVGSTVPADDATNVAVGGNITATFSEAMDATTISGTTFTLSAGATPVAGAVSYAGVVATFNPTANLAGSTLYTATITTGAKDTHGNALAGAKVWTFTTADITAPTVSSTVPANAATNVAVGGNITATFSEAMNATTISGTTFTLSAGATPVAGAVSYAGLVATFNPTANLAGSTVYTATISTGAQDLAGNALASAKVWTFTTVAPAIAPVNLGAAGNYVILAQSGISTVPTSAITGDIAVSPAAATFITGFGLTADASNVFSTSPQVTGQVFAADYAVPTPSNLTTAVSDMGTAYTDAAGRAPGVTELNAGEIGGLTLVPGVYKWSSGLSISLDVTLSGGATDVWIFQIAGGLTVASGKSVILSGGALPKNIFWQVADVVALDTTAHFEGVVLAQTAITLATGATVNGRLLAQTAVTLDQSTVVQPAP